MKLEPDGIGGERPERQPCPLDRVFTFLVEDITEALWGTRVSPSTVRTAALHRRHGMVR